MEKTARKQLLRNTAIVCALLLTAAVWMICPVMRAGSCGSGPETKSLHAGGY
ncbi:MAG: hypothetical protein U5K27_04930 [Desulfotignum sp.]|nr:hypothetical protein [Desulfotignum sp.]